MLANNYKKLDLNNRPENTYIYCNDCGLKNRGDVNWVYKDDPSDSDVLRVRSQIPMAQMYMQMISGTFSDTQIAKNYYLCDKCRKKHGVKLRNRKPKKTEEDQNTT